MAETNIMLEAGRSGRPADAVPAISPDGDASG
jgi:hypothetical protein